MHQELNPDSECEIIPLNGFKNSPNCDIKNTLPTKLNHRNSVSSSSESSDEQVRILKTTN